MGSAIKNETIDCNSLSDSRPYSVAVVSDCHILGNANERFRGVDTRESLIRVLADVACNKPDVLILGGDLSHDGSEESYLSIPALLAMARCPWYAIAGNHDDLELMRRLFGTERLLDDIVLGRWRLRGLTSAVPGLPGGALSPSERRRLVQDLEDADHDWIIVLHHHLLPTGSRWIDETLLDDAKTFLAMCISSPHVRLVLHGHTHDAVETRHETLSICAIPSTALRFSHPTMQLGSFHGPTPVGWRQLLLFPDGRYHTQVRWLPST